MDILRELSDDELKYIINKLKEKHPYTLKDLYYINSAQTCARESEKYDWTFSTKALPKFYTHRYGVKENCTTFGITGDENHTVWYFSFDDSLNEIKECLAQTKLIRWRTDLLFVTLHAEQIQPVFDCASKNGCHKVLNEENSYYFLPIQDALNFEIEIPPEVYMAPLDVSDAAICNNLWKYKNAQSELWIKTLITVHGGYGLRDKNNHELLSFALINDHMAIGVLTTLEKSQRKGYGQVVVKYLAKKLAEQDLIPHVYVSKQNEKGKKLFEKLGFRRIGDSNWILIE